MSARLGDIQVAMAEGIVSRLVASQELADALGVELAGIAERVWDAVPPSGATLPYILLSVIEPEDIGPVGMTILYARGLATVKVVGESHDYEDLAPIARAIHAALQGAVSVPLSGGGTMMTCRRIRSVAYPEQTQGIEYRHLGGTYEMTAQ